MTKSKTETGDAVNIGSFSREIDLCISYGPKYDPSNNLIKIPTMQALKAAGETAVTDLLNLRTPAKNAINLRELGFAPLSKLMTRVANATKASDVSDKFIKDVVNLIKKINGIRVIPKIKQDENTPPEKIIKYISASQMGCDNRLAHLEELISLLTGEPNYLPSENDLKVASLGILYNDLKTKHENVSATHSLMMIALHAKNNILYRESDGIVETGGRVKKYVKSVFGGNSPEFHDAAKCKFTKRKL